MSEVYEVISKYGKMMTGQGYPVGDDAMIIIETAEGVFTTKPGADLGNLKEEDIEKKYMKELPVPRADMKALVYSQTPYLTKCLREAKPFPAALDDMAQVFGPACYVIDARPSKNPKVVGKAMKKALKHNMGCMVLKGADAKGKGMGYTLTMGRNLYEAVVAMQVLEKNAEIFCHAEKLGGVAPLSKMEARLMRAVYKSKYSKAEAEVKTSEVR